MSIKKMFPNQCPQCGGSALEYPIFTEYLPAAPHCFIELLECKDCQHRWNEFYEKRYLGYEDASGTHPNSFN